MQSNLLIRFSLAFNQIQFIHFNISAYQGGGIEINFSHLGEEL